MTNGRSTRRVTLSHAELEEFLTDSGQSIEVNPRGYREVEISECDNLITPRKISKDSAYTFRASSDEESIREFCMLITQQKGSIPAMKARSIAKVLLERTNYAILPQRTIYPENYPTCPESLDAKRTLLLGMTGMIADAEKQRKRDAVACEVFTKCKAEKSRYKNPVFVYSDVDTGNFVESEEYEQRYLMHLSNLKSMSRLSPRSLKITEFGAPKSFDAFRAVTANIRTPREEERKKSVDCHSIELKEGFNKENSGPSPINCTTSFFRAAPTPTATFFSSTCPSLISANFTPPTISTTAPPSTPLFLSAATSPTMASASPSIRRRPRPLVLHPLDTSPPSQTTPKSPVKTPEARKALTQRVSLSPTTARFKMLEAMVEEATTATAEAYAASRKNTAPSSSSSNRHTKLPTFSSTNPFGRVPKTIAPAPSSATSSSIVTSTSQGEGSNNTSKENKFEYQKTVDLTEKKKNKLRDSQDSDSTHDCITGLPDMQLVRDHNQIKDKADSPYDNCQGVLEKVSVLLKLFQTHTDDVPSELEETSDLFVVPEMTPAFLSMSRRSNTPVDQSSLQPTVACIGDTIAPLTVTFSDTDRGPSSSFTAISNEIYQENDSTDDVNAVKTPMRCAKAPTFSPDLVTKLRECTLDKSAKERSFCTAKEYYSTPETREYIERTDSKDQISPLSECSSDSNEAGKAILSPSELIVSDVKSDCHALSTSPLTATSSTPGGRTITVMESVKKASVISMRPSRMLSLRGVKSVESFKDSFKTPPPSSKTDYSVSRSDVDRLRGLLCVPLNTDRGTGERIEGLEGGSSSSSSSSMCRSASTNSVGDMSACKAAVSRIIAPTPIRRIGGVGWMGTGGLVSDTNENVKYSTVDGSISSFTDLGKVQKEGRMRRSIGSRGALNGDVSPVSSTHTDQEGSGKDSSVSNRTHSVALNSAAFESSSEIMRTYALEAVMTNIETAEDAEKRAAYRLSIRCKVAEWRYHWELVSYQAAKVARLLFAESF